MLLDDTGEVSTSPAALQPHLRGWKLGDTDDSRTYRFVQPSARADGAMGIVPKLCDRMLTERKKAKKRMEAEEEKLDLGDPTADATLAKNLDAKQNALKVVRALAQSLLPSPSP